MPNVQVIGISEVMDIIFINGLKVDAVIGVFDWEKKIKQPLIFDLELGWNIKPAASNDDLSKTLDYAQISVDIENFTLEKPVELVETLAENLASFLMNKYHIPWLSLVINKPDAVSNAVSVGVKIERGNKV